MIDALTSGGAIVIALGLVEVIKMLVKRRNGNSNVHLAKCIKDMLYQQQRTAEHMDQLAQMLGGLTTTMGALTTMTAVLDTKVTGLDAKLDRMAV